MILGIQNWNSFWFFPKLPFDLTNFKINFIYMHKKLIIFFCQTSLLFSYGSYVEQKLWITKLNFSSYFSLFFWVHSKIKLQIRKVYSTEVKKIFDTLNNLRLLWILSWNLILCNIIFKVLTAMSLKNKSFIKLLETIHKIFTKYKSMKLYSLQLKVRFLK